LLAWFRRGAKRPGVAVPGRARAAEGPVDLGADLAAICSPVAAAGRALAAVRERAGETRESGALALFVGLRQTRYLVLVLVLALRSRVLRVAGHDDEVAALWANAPTASQCAQSLAALLGADPEEAALLGLVHDVGRVAVLAALAELERTTRGQQRVDPEALASISDSLHAVLGAMLADVWSLSPALVAAISHRHDPDSAPAAMREFARIARGGDGLARALVGSDPGSSAPPIDGVDPELAQAALDEAREAHEELSKRM